MRCTLGTGLPPACVLQSNPGPALCRLLLPALCSRLLAARLPGSASEAQLRLSPEKKRLSAAEPPERPAAR